MNLPDSPRAARHDPGRRLRNRSCAPIGPGMVIESLRRRVSPASPAGFDPANLVRFEGRNYTVENEDWVATEPLSTARVKKVEAGRVSYVTITTTATGTYSTDAMFSNHVQYPGIDVTERRRYPHNRFSYWSGGNWSASPAAAPIRSSTPQRRHAGHQLSTTSPAFRAGATASASRTASRA